MLFQIARESVELSVLQILHIFWGIWVISLGVQSHKVLQSAGQILDSVTHLLVVWATHVEIANYRLVRQVGWLVQQLLVQYLGLILNHLIFGQEDVAHVLVLNQGLRTQMALVS